MPNMREFKIGDIVKVHRGMTAASRNLNGKIGVIEKLSNCIVGRHIGYVVLDIDTHKGGVWFDEISHIKETQSQKLNRKMKGGE